MRYAIVTCVTPNWLPAAAVTLLSCANNGAAAFADLLIVSPNPTAAQRLELEAFNIRHDVNLVLIEIELSDLEQLGRGRLGVGSLLRLKLDQSISAHYERVLYIDSDILATASCAALFLMNLRGMAFGAVESTTMLPFIKTNAAMHACNIGMHADTPYFNAGVMIFDWQLTRQQGLLAKSLDRLKVNPTLLWQDQDALNTVAQGHWHKLEHHWNVTKKTADYIHIKPSFRHFNGRAKPWNTAFRLGYGKYRKFYISCLKDTSWEDFTIAMPQHGVLKENWRALVRKLSFIKIAQLKRHIAATDSPRLSLSKPKIYGPARPAT